MVMSLTEQNTRQDTQDYYASLWASAQQALSRLQQGEFVIVEARDVRLEDQVVPLAKVVVDVFQRVRQLWLKEIIIVVPNNLPSFPITEDLHMVHRYVLVFEVTV